MFLENAEESGGSGMLGSVGAGITVAYTSES